MESEDNSARLPQRTKSVRELLAAIERLRGDGQSSALATTLRQLGEAERKSGDRASARKHYEEAVGILRRRPDSLLLAHTVRHLGDVYRDLGEMPLARLCCEEALTLYRSHPNAAALDVANSVRSMALVEQAFGNLQAARQLWKEARDAYQALGVSAGVAECEQRVQGLDDSFIS